MSEQRISIVGGGFAGVWAAVGAARTLRAARRTDVLVELVSPDPYLVIRPRLYEADLSGVRVPLASVLDPIGVRHRRASVVGIDHVERRLELDDGSAPQAYDQIVLAPGSRLQLPPGPVHAVDGYQQALALGGALTEAANRADGEFRVVVVGGGFTGIELACELASSGQRPMRATGGRSRSRVTLVEGAASVAPEFGDNARQVIRGALAALGVEARTGIGVAAVDETGVTLADGDRLAADLVVWCAGPRASVLTEQLPAVRDRLGRLQVDRFLATGVDGIWAAGDSAAARVERGHDSVMSCQHAMPQGRRAGENAARAVLGQRPRPYRQPLYLTCLDLGDQGALLTCGFERDTVLASGAGAKAFKRYINRSLIYPPAGADPEQLLRLGLPGPTGAGIAALTRLALRSNSVRERVTRTAEDRAARFATA